MGAGLGNFTEYKPRTAEEWRKLRQDQPRVKRVVVSVRLYPDPDAGDLDLIAAGYVLLLRSYCPFCRCELSVYEYRWTESAGAGKCEPEYHVLHLQSDDKMPHEGRCRTLESAKKLLVGRKL